MSDNAKTTAALAAVLAEHHGRHALEWLDTGGLERVTALAEACAERCGASEQGSPNASATNTWHVTLASIEHRRWPASAPRAGTGEATIEALAHAPRDPSATTSETLQIVWIETLAEHTPSGMIALECHVPSALAREHALAKLQIAMDRLSKGVREAPPPPADTVRAEIGELQILRRERRLGRGRRKDLEQLVSEETRSLATRAWTPAGEFTHRHAVWARDAGGPLPIPRGLRAVDSYDIEIARAVFEYAQIELHGLAGETGHHEMLERACRAGAPMWTPEHRGETFVEHAARSGAATSPVPIPQALRGPAGARTAIGYPSRLVRLV